ncbi:MAG: LuxR C-terminal-related transcriptional regulator [Cyclobacteriaceae bacterium]|nr:LuxR C-terminal-related transcriptional regulator [Cyclobacteriaceae bacterium]
MINYLTIGLLIISTALALAGLLVAIILNRKYDSPLFFVLIFHQLFTYIFGFYGLWGQLALTAFLSPVISTALFEKIAGISLFTAFPFMVMGWSMLLVVAENLTQSKPKTLLYRIVPGAVFILLIALGVLYRKLPSLNITGTLIYFFMAFNTLASALSAIILFRHKKKEVLLSGRSIRHLATGIIISMLLLGFLAPLLNNEIYFVLAFILIFFMSGAFIPLYIRYVADISPLLLQTSSKITFAAFCQRFEISKREESIIMEICQGLSNQEIADKLFISLQTVKGHTSRIYVKTNIKSRAQLIAIMNNIQ